MNCTSQVVRWMPFGNRQKCFWFRCLIIQILNIMSAWYSDAIWITNHSTITHSLTIWILVFSYILIPTILCFRVKPQKTFISCTLVLHECCKEIIVHCHPPLKPAWRRRAVNRRAKNIIVFESHKVWSIPKLQVFSSENLLHGRGQTNWQLPTEQGSHKTTLTSPLPPPPQLACLNMCGNHRYHER